MQSPPNPAPSAPRRTLLADAMLATALAAFLTICWALTDWSRLSHMLLPDTDDMIRLAQVRDWIAGQAFNDWTQYRMAPPLGVAMHWSRVNDLGIAGIIVAATPILGTARAELAAVLLYPALLFAANLFLSARIARRLWGPEAGVIAAILASLAYPGIALFLPGRIDHHALQAVVILATVLALMQAPSLRNGALAGLLVALSLVIGLETAPQVAALTGALALFWVVRGMEERRRLAGFAGTLAAATGLFVLTLRPSFWSPALCDAFTPASAAGTVAVSAALGLLAWATPWLKDWRARVAAGAVLGGVALGMTLLAYPACRNGPYALMDPFLLREFMPHIDEANSIFAQRSVAHALSIAGLLIVGCIASIWMAIRRREHWQAMLPLLGVIAVSALVALFQARGTYIGAPAVPPVLAGVILAARQRTRWHTPALIGAWVACTGIGYAYLPELAARIEQPGKPSAKPGSPRSLCNDGDVWAQVDRYPPGVAMASVNIGAYLIGSTHMGTVGAGYHRNDLGNMAMYRYFLSSPDAGAAIAREWQVSYVLFCPGDFAEMDAGRRFPNSLAARLAAGQTPAGLERLPLNNAQLQLYRVR